LRVSLLSMRRNLKSAATGFGDDSNNVIKFA
jgi:hypothetical protein